MYTKMIFRPAVKKDKQSIKRLFKSWISADACTLDLESVPAPGEHADARYRVLEMDKSVTAAMLWVEEQPGEVRILALGMDPRLAETGDDQRFIREAVLEWSEMRMTKVTARLPEPLADDYLNALKTSGFMFEGISSCCGPKQIPRVHLCKHFLYTTIQHSKVIDFLKDFLTTLGYEIRPEDEGFGFRLKNDYRLPFIFSPWHRITRSGSDIIIHPPARVLEMHEIETLFYPLRILMAGEKPLLLPMEKKRAEFSIELPNVESKQDSLFDPESMRRRSLFSNDLAVSLPGAYNHVRRGLPLLFYVNKIGAVGIARIEDFYLDEPKNLFNQIDEMSFFDPADIVEHAAQTGPKAGKVLVIRFQWYKPFKKIISFDEIKQADESFNPQRGRSIALNLFKTITAAGMEFSDN